MKLVTLVTFLSLLMATMKISGHNFGPKTSPTFKTSMR